MVKIEIIGRLTADPSMNEVRGKNCTNFTVAADTNLKDSDGNKITQFYRVSAWGKQAEACAKFINKASQVFVSGSLKVDTYSGSDGSTKVGLSISANEVQFLGGKQKSEENDMFND